MQFLFFHRMNPTLPVTQSAPTNLNTAIADALDRIPPLWPLRHFVAVNPYLGLLDESFTEACATLQRTFGSAPLQQPQDYLDAYHSGIITREHLALVANSDWPIERLLSILVNPENHEPAPIPTVAEFLDRKHPHAHWNTFIVDEISKWCGVTFDENQTTWNSPWKSCSLYTAWRQAAVHDRNPEAFGLSGFRSFVEKLPDTPGEAIEVCIAVIAPDTPPLTDFLHRQLASIAGWAGHAQYRVREDKMRGRKNPALLDLLAIRLAYDTALHQALLKTDTKRTAWRHALRQAPTGDADLLAARIRWQQAYEAGYFIPLARKLAERSLSAQATRPVAQAVFCIDVRSEVFRRHLESALPGVQTIGFAGFFGFPVQHHPASDPGHPGARCPVLLVPPVQTCEPLPPEQALARNRRKTEAGAWKAFQNSATSCFSFVESVGLAFGAALGCKPKSSHTSCGCTPAPHFSSISTETRADMAEGALRNMSLTKNFARLILICGHGSHSANNPYASALDCGACGGHAGDVNARLAADTLNDPSVRNLLAQRGIKIPADSFFLAGLHDTLSDDVTLFCDHSPASHSDDIHSLRVALADAGFDTRRERAASLGLDHLSDDHLEHAIRMRGCDISQVRPEWGLANNAALIAAPRHRSADLKLDGRVFLHDYLAAEDPEDKVLTLILSAPVVVASWINLQYYASRIDPAKFGSGNKVLHNVIGGIGVLEGNSGDLKVGLPIQSIHNGEKFVHEPRRLSVFIEAPRHRIDNVLARHPEVARLFENEWIHLISLEETLAFRHTLDGWMPVP
jgi:uncharacterized protein YbcC (UPF0753/DUF2309 family)